MHWQTSSQAYGAFYKLPPRERVKDPQHTLLVALAPAVSSKTASPGVQPASGRTPPIDKAWLGLGVGLVLRARVVPQPGDGSCLFHSLADSSKSEPLQLRHAIADFIESQPDTPIGGEPLREWVKWDSCLSPDTYAVRMRGAGSWGGAIEIAVRCASRMRTPCIHAHSARSSPTRCHTACARTHARRSGRYLHGSLGSPCTCMSHLQSQSLTRTTASRPFCHRTTQNSTFTYCTVVACTTILCSQCE